MRTNLSPFEVNDRVINRGSGAVGSIIGGELHDGVTPPWHGWFVLWDGDRRPRGEYSTDDLRLLDIPESRSRADVEVWLDGH